MIGELIISVPLLIQLVTPRPGFIASVLMAMLEFILLFELVYVPAYSKSASSLAAVSMEGKSVSVIRSASNTLLVVGFAPAERMEKPMFQSGMRTNWAEYPVYQKSRRQHTSFRCFRELNVHGALGTLRLESSKSCWILKQEEIRLKKLELTWYVSIFGVEIHDSVIGGLEAQDFPRCPDSGEGI